MDLARSADWGATKGHLYHMSEPQFVRYRGDADDAQVRWGSNDDPRQLLSTDVVYTVERVEVHSSHTKVYLKEVPGKKFNSVHFDELVKVPNVREPITENDVLAFFRQAKAKFGPGHLSLAIADGDEYPSWSFWGWRDGTDRHRAPKLEELIKMLGEDTPARRAAARIAALEKELADLKAKTPTPTPAP